jgi:hypothetical protein
MQNMHNIMTSVCMGPVPRADDATGGRVQAHYPVSASYAQTRHCVPLTVLECLRVSSSAFQPVSPQAINSLSR